MHSVLLLFRGLSGRSHWYQQGMAPEADWKVIMMVLRVTALG